MRSIRESLFTHLLLPSVKRPHTNAYIRSKVHIEESEVDQFVRNYIKAIKVVEKRDNIHKYKPQITHDTGWLQNDTSSLPAASEISLRAAQQRVLAKRQEVRSLQSEFTAVGGLWMPCALCVVVQLCWY